MPKRKSQSNSISNSKKVKIEPCYFPFHIKDIVRKIAYYLEGDHLKNFKLTCKKSNEITKEMSCAIEMTEHNFERTSTITGYHIIKMNGDETVFKSCYDRQNIKKIILDYGGIKSQNHSEINYFIQPFYNLQSLRIIRCMNNISIIIRNTLKFSSLEIYTSGNINVTLFRHLENGLLCSMGEYMDGYSNVDISVIFDVDVVYAKNIKCKARRNAIIYGYPSHTFLHDTLETFVPKPEYLP